MKFELPKLNYNYDGLEPFMDRETVEIHYSKHHQTYLNNLNVALEKAELKQTSIEDLLKNIEQLPKEIQTSVKNNGGGYYNHMLFWQMLAPAAGQKPQGKLLKAIEQNFGSFDQFKTAFEEAGKKHFGSGWVWLIQNKEGKLQILSLLNQDTPLHLGKPLLCVDLWEHSYYLKFQNRRADYLTNIWNIINWRYSEKQFEAK